MGKLRTSAAYYRRGISNTDKNFAFAVQGNYPLVQPNILFRNSILYPPVPPSPPQPNPNITVPSPPLNVTAVLSSNQQVLVTWSPPLKDGGSEILSYTVTSSPGNITEKVSSKKNQVYISGLTDGLYTFTVTATNSKGTSPPSAASNSVAITPYQQGSPWPHLGGLFNNNSYNVPYDSVITANYNLFFKNTNSDAIITTPVIDASGTVYVSSKDEMFAINADKTLKWKCDYDIYNSYSCAAIGSDGTVYVGSNYNQGSVYFFPPDSSGEYVKPQILAPKSDASGFVNTNPIISNNTLYIGGYSGFWAFDLSNNPKNASLLWKAPLFNGQYYYSTAAVGNDGTIYISNDTNLFAFDSSQTPGSLDVQPKWVSKDFNSRICPTPTIGKDGKIYIYTNDYLLAFAPTSSTSNPVDPTSNPVDPTWKYFTGSYVNGSVALGQEGTIFLSTFDAIRGEGYVNAIKPDGNLDVSYSNIACFSLCVGRHPTTGKDLVYIGDPISQSVVALQYNPGESFTPLFYQPLQNETFYTSLYGLSQSFSLDASGNLYVPILGGSSPNLYMFSPGTGYQKDSPWPYWGGLYNDNSRDVPYSSVYRGSAEVFFKNQTPDLSGGPFITTPVIDASGSVYVSTYNSVFVIDKTGYHLTDHYFDNIDNRRPTAAAIARDGTAYVAGNNSLIAISPDKTSVSRDNFLGRYSYFNGSSPVISNNVLYIGITSTFSGPYSKGGLVAVQLTDNPVDAYILWASGFPPVGGVGFTPAIGTDGTIYQMNYIPPGQRDIYPSGFTILAAFNPFSNGLNNHIKWVSEPFFTEIEPGQEIFLQTSPVIGSNGSIYVLPPFNGIDGNSDISFCVFDPCNNPLVISDSFKLPYNPSRTQTNIPNAFATSPALGQDGRVYVSTMGGLYALDENGGILATFTDISCQAVPCVGRHPKTGNDIVYVNDEKKNGTIVVALEYNNNIKPPSFARLSLSSSAEFIPRGLCNQGFSLDACGNLYVVTRGTVENPNIYICKNKNQ